MTECLKCNGTNLQGLGALSNQVPNRYTISETTSDMHVLIELDSLDVHLSVFQRKIAAVQDPNALAALAEQIAHTARSLP